MSTALVNKNMVQFSSEQVKNFSEMISNIYPRSRIGEPSDIAGAAVFLISQQANWRSVGLYSRDLFVSYSRPMVK